MFKHIQMLVLSNLKQETKIRDLFHSVKELKHEVLGLGLNSILFKFMYIQNVICMKRILSKAHGLYRPFPY